MSDATAPPSEPAAMPALPELHQYAQHGELQKLNELLESGQAHVMDRDAQNIVRCLMPGLAHFVDLRTKTALHWAAYASLGRPLSCSVPA
jgi:hypothetical protein